MRRAPAIALAVTLPLLLAACGDGGEELVVEATPAGVRSASQATLGAETVSVEFSVTVDPAGMGLPVSTRPVAFTGAGVIDFADQRGEMTFDLAGLAEGLGELGEDAGPFAGLFDQPLRAIQDGTTTYACLPRFQVFAGAECVKFDVDEMLGRDAAESFLTGGGLDAEAVLESLGGAEEVEEVGEEELFGVTTHHLRGSFTLAAALEELDPAAAEQLQAAFASVGIIDELVDTPQTFDVWIDDDGLIRQVRQELDLGAITGEEGEPIVAEFRYVDFGVPVDIAIPADAVDVGELEGVLGGD